MIIIILKVTNVSQLKYVEDEDLGDMGMTKPESRRLKKFFRKECPQGTFGKLKKVLKLGACCQFTKTSFPLASKVLWGRRNG